MKHHMSTYVSVPEEDGQAKLRALASERLGGTEGLECVSWHLVSEQLCGTFTRTWEDPEPDADPVPETKE